MLKNGKNLLNAKNLIGWISGHHSQESINHEQAIISIKNLTTTLNYLKIPTYNLIFTPIPNWNWSCRDFFLYAWILVRVWLPSNLLIVIGYKVLHFKARWRSESTWLQNPKVHKNGVASHRVYEFSKLSLCAFYVFKITLLYVLEV